MRYAIYLTPPPRSPFLSAAEGWLGRSAFGRTVGPPAAPEEANVAVPARYGFHATLRAPFQLAKGADEAKLMTRFASHYDGAPTIPVRLVVGTIARFVALTAHDNAPLADAATRAMEAVDDLRGPLTAADRQRRHADRLDERGRELLDRWGYPHVLERFLFHMTLSGPVEGDTAPVVEAAERHFADHLGRTQTLIHALFREESRGGPFRIIALQRTSEVLT